MNDSAKKIVRDLLERVRPYQTGSRVKPIGYEILPADLLDLVIRAQKLKEKRRERKNSL